MLIFVSICRGIEDTSYCICEIVSLWQQRLDYMVFITKYSLE